MTWLDYAVAGVFVASVAWGIWRGLVREIVAILGWLVAFLAASLFAGPLSLHVPEAIPTPELRNVAAFAGIFLCALVATSLLGMLLARLVSAVGLGALDRLLGAGFGAARGAVLVLALALLAGLTAAPLQAWWRESACGPLLAGAALVAKPWLPPAFADRLRYH